MHRAQLLTLLKNYQISFAEDREFLSRVQRFVSENENCFARECIPGHITGSAWIVDGTRTSILLTHHTKLNRWFQLGGHADGDSDVFAVALKEAQEESGLTRISPISKEIFDIDVHLIPDKQGGHYHYDVRFLFQADPSERLVLNRESKELAWVFLNKVEEYTQERSVLRMKEKTLLTYNS